MVLQILLKLSLEMQQNQDYFVVKDLENKHPIWDHSILRNYNKWMIIKDLQGTQSDDVEGFQVIKFIKLADFGMILMPILALPTSMYFFNYGR